jgi:hypothetical protein
VPAQLSSSSLAVARNNDGSFFLVKAGFSSTGIRTLGVELNERLSRGREKNENLHGKFDSQWVSFSIAVVSCVCELGFGFLLGVGREASVGLLLSLLN